MSEQNNDTFASIEEGGATVGPIKTQSDEKKTATFAQVLNHCMFYLI